MMENLIHALVLVSRQTNETVPISPPPDNDTNVPCRLLDNWAFALQAIMGTLALASLVLKRNSEKFPRSWNVWALDSGKQVVGQVFGHFLTIGVAYLSDTGTERNPCVYYFLHLLLGATIGVGFLWCFLKLAHFVTETYGIPDCDSGNYGPDPLRPSVKAWGKQLLIFCLCQIGVKIGVLVLLAIFPALTAFGRWVVGLFHNEKLQVFFVLLVFPLILNMAQFWLVDGLIKGRAFGRADVMLEAGENSQVDFDSSLLAVDHDEDDAAVDANGGLAVNNRKKPSFDEL
jgi:hypothetical protein